MYDDAWSASVSNQLTVLDDNLLALHLAKFAVRQQQRWLLVQVRLMVMLLELLMKRLGRVMLLMLITKILIVVVVVVVVVMGATAATVLMMTICVVVLVVSSVVLTVVLLLIMATDEVIVLVVRWNRSTRCSCPCRSRWWRYQYVVLIFRKVQIVVDVVVVAAVELLLQDTVGVLDRNWLTTVVAVSTIKVLILFQLVNQRTSLRVTATTLMVVLQYPRWTTVIVQLLSGLMRVVIVVTFSTVGWFQLDVLATGGYLRMMTSCWMLLGIRNSLLRHRR